MSVSNTAFLFHIPQNVILVRATCFDLTRSSSGPPRRQIQELFMFYCIVGSQIYTFSSIYIRLRILFYILYSCNKNLVSIWDPKMQWNTNSSWMCLLGGTEDDPIRSKHVALTSTLLPRLSSHPLKALNSLFPGFLAISYSCSCKNVPDRGGFLALSFTKRSHTNSMTSSLSLLRLTRVSKYHFSF